jgi:tRNA(Arg) A34 adenosine deaminase TadA
VTSSNDPTAHAEVVAIREACHKLQSFQLAGCEVYTSCEPCPMCLGALYWARPDVIYFGAGRQDAAEINFDDQFIYDELNLELSSRSLPAVQLLREEALAPFALWSKSTMKIPY